jgi:hypothetical protein
MPIMKKFYFILLLFINLAAIGQETIPQAQYVPGEILVKIDDPIWLGEIISGLQIVNSEFTGLRVSKEVSKPVNIWLLSFDESAITHAEMIAALYTNKHILIAQNNHIIQERITVPNDPTFPSQWHHVDASDNDIDSDLAWDITTGGTTAYGDEIVVCVIEGGGSDWDHPDLLPNHWVNEGEIDNNGIDDDGNGYIDDYNGWNSGNNNDNIATGNHGTGVSGMIGAKGNNSLNLSGINWNVKIMQVDMGSMTESNVIAAYTYPYVMRQRYNNSGGTEGAFVVATNASWGIDGGDPDDAPLWCDFYNTLGEEGILNCGATANSNWNIDVVGDLPTACSSPYMISVTATNSSDVRTFSGYGQTTIDLGAPGESVYTLANTNTTTSTSGTSFATPLTAGVIALIYSVPCSDIGALALSDPQEAADLVRQALFDGTDPVANLTSETVTGGRLNAYNSVLLISDLSPFTFTGSTTATAVASGNDGSINLTVVGGNAPLDFDWSGTGGFSASTEDVSGLSEGSYDVTVTDVNGCEFELIDIIIGNSAGIGEFANVYRIYPNPAHDAFTIDVMDSQSYTLQLYDAGGKIILSQTIQKSTTIAVSQFPRGTYLYTLTDATNTLFSEGKIILN